MVSSPLTDRGFSRRAPPSRRRFDVFECPPDADVLRRYYSGKDNRSDVPDLVEGFVRLNDELVKQLERPGHS
jgi:hypothetical protein